MQTDRIEGIFKYQLEWIKAADSKVPPMFAINMAMLGVLSATIKPTTFWSVPSIFSTVLTFLLLMVSIFFLSLVIYPQLKGPETSNIFFGGIAKKNIQEYSEALSSSENDYTLDLIAQTHVNAEIANKKYNNIKYSMTATFLSAPFWALSLYYLYI